jgi:hypothetical protein
VSILSADEHMRQVDWLLATLGEEVPDLTADRSATEVVRLSFPGSGRAEQFHAALMAENLVADLDGATIRLPVAPWYTPADVESLALAVAKVAHYLR